MLSSPLMRLIFGAAFVAGLHIGFVEGKRKATKGWQKPEEIKPLGTKGVGAKDYGMKSGDKKKAWEVMNDLLEERREEGKDRDVPARPSHVADEDGYDKPLAQDERRRLYARRDDNAPVVCFVRSTGFERQGTARFKAAAVPADKCTHVVYSYLETDNKTGELLFRKRGHEDEKEILKNLVNLKRENRKLKVLFSYGGGAHVNSLLNRLHSDRDEALLVNTIVTLISSLGLWGVNFHLEGPGPSICNEKDVPKVLRFFKKLRLSFGLRDWLITAQLPACGNPKCDKIPKEHFARYLDYLFLMTFDYKLDDLSKTKLTSGLYFYEGDKSTAIETESCLGRWINAGVPTYKIVPGIATYGRSFTLKDPKYNGVSAKLDEKHPLGYASNMTKTDGYMDYVETCRRAGYMGWRREWVKYTATPYIYHKNQWVSYDDKDSVDVKVKWFRKHWLGGVFVWSLEADDISGDCLGEVFPMVEAAWKPLKGYRPLLVVSQAKNLPIEKPIQARIIPLSVLTLFKPGIIGFIKGMMGLG